MSDIKVLALNTGNMIIGKIEHEIVGSSYDIDDPIELVWRPDDKGEMTLGFAPFYPMLDRPVKVNFASVAFEGNPESRLLDAYREMTTGIVTAQETDVPNLKLTK